MKNELSRLSNIIKNIDDNNVISVNFPYNYQEIDLRVKKLVKGKKLIGSKNINLKFILSLIYKISISYYLYKSDINEKLDFYISKLDVEKAFIDVEHIIKYHDYLNNTMGYALELAKNIIIYLNKSKYEYFYMGSLKKNFTQNAISKEFFDTSIELLWRYEYIYEIAPSSQTRLGRRPSIIKKNKQKIDETINKLTHF